MKESIYDTIEVTIGDEEIEVVIQELETLEHPEDGGNGVVVAKIKSNYTGEKPVWICGIHGVSECAVSESLRYESWYTNKQAAIDEHCRLCH